MTSRKTPAIAFPVPRHIRRYLPVPACLWREPEAWWRLLAEIAGRRMPASLRDWLDCGLIALGCLHLVRERRFAVLH